jgi:hypothetical protein
MPLPTIILQKARIWDPPSYVFYHNDINTDASEQFWALLKIGLTGTGRGDVLLRRQRVIVAIEMCCFAFGPTLLAAGFIVSQFHTEMAPFLSMAGLLGVGLCVLMKFDKRRNVRELVALYNTTANPRDEIIFKLPGQ